jgi:transcriptional regulator with XRE-family HTH domain
MNRIKLLRERKGYSQKELGDKIGVTQYAISKWELGQREPSAQDLFRLCEVLEATTDYLLGRTGANSYAVELAGEQIPADLRAVGLERVRLLRAYVDELDGSIHPEIQRELLRLIAEAKLLQNADNQKP